MKTMKMNKLTDKNSAGIYAKKSTGVTTVGDGLASLKYEDVKSPVIKIKRLKIKDNSNEKKETTVTNDSTENEKENQDIKEENENNDTLLSKTDVLECDASNALIDDDVIIVTEPTTVIVLDSEDENDKSHEDSANQNQEPEHHTGDDVNKESHQDNDKQNVEESEHLIDDNDKQNVEESEQHIDDNNSNQNDVENSNKNPFKEQGTSSVRSSAPKTPLNQKILEFPMCKSRYGSDRYNKAIDKLQEIGYITWEVNTMFGALEKYFIKRFGKRPIPQEDLRRFKKPRLDDDQSKEKQTHDQSKEKQSEPGAISGVLVDNDKTYVTFDLRANIGDANHPNFHILPQNMDALYVELVQLLQQQKWMPHQPFVSCSYINQTLMVECKNEQILTYIVRNIFLLNRRFTGADFVLIPRSCERKTILIYIPYSYLDVAVVLDIIKKQNKLPVDEWKVNSSETWQEGICLDVEVDGGTYLRLIQDQDDIFFLMKKATIRLPPDVEDS